MDKMPLHCRNCGNLGTRACPGGSNQGMLCSSYLSWSEHWAREMAIIERTLRNTYIAAVFFAVLAAATVMLPTSLS